MASGADVAFVDDPVAGAEETAPSCRRRRVCRVPGERDWREIMWPHLLEQADASGHEDDEPNSDARNRSAQQRAKRQAEGEREHDIPDGHRALKVEGIA